MTETIATAGLTTIVDGVHHLTGSRCTGCAVHTFPRQGSCPRCGSAMETVALPTTGTVWSWTIQRNAPKPPYAGPTDPDAYTPFAVAYVDLGVVKVESVLSGADPESWSIGDPADLVAEPGPDGTVEHFTFGPPTTEDDR